MGKPGATGMRRIVHATRYSAQGFVQAWRYEAAFRQEIGLFLAALPAAMWLGESTMERIALISPLLIVLIVELLNSAVEAAIDRVGAEHHDLSGRAKDFGSAAVFLSLALTAVIWIGIGWERLAS